jgi:hypothetical protein
MAESYIKRTKSSHGFTILQNDIFKSGLSLEALGIICFILQLPDDWVLRKSHLMKLFNIGRDKTDRIFKELKSKGYIADVVRVRNADGRYDGVHYLVYDTPHSHHTENHTTENQYTGKHATTNNEYYKELITPNTKQTTSAKKHLDDIEDIFK